MKAHYLVVSKRGWVCGRSRERERVWGAVSVAVPANSREVTLGVSVYADGAKQPPTPQHIDAH